MANKMKGITCCGDCVYYDWKKHRCKRGFNDATNPQNHFFDNCALPDVQPVVHGRWVGFPECLKYPNAYSDDHIVCSACEECFSVLDNCTERFDYCPHCGAKMDLEVNDAKPD